MKHAWALSQVCAHVCPRLFAYMCYMYVCAHVGESYLHIVANASNRYSVSLVLFADWRGYRIPDTKYMYACVLEFVVYIYMLMCICGYISSSRRGRYVTAHTINRAS